MFKKSDILKQHSVKDNYICSKCGKKMNWNDRQWSFKNNMRDYNFPNKWFKWNLRTTWPAIPIMCQSSEMYCWICTKLEKLKE